jgi:nitrous oxide reductase accessory protein NosL
MRTLSISLSLAVVLAGTACETPSPQPVEIDAADICAQCKMAISERRYAAELADADGIVKFDNVDCMVRYALARNLKEKATAWFVMDSNGKNWLDARQALLVRSASIPGPMGNGVLAERDHAAADELSRRFSGQILRFDDLWSR